MARQPSTPEELAWAKWLGATLRAGREAKSMSRNSLSRAAECSPNHIQRVEDGNSPGIGFLMLSRIAAELSIDSEILYKNFVERKS